MGHRRIWLNVNRARPGKKHVGRSRWRIRKRVDVRDRIDKKVPIHTRAVGPPDDRDWRSRDETVRRRRLNDDCIRWIPFLKRESRHLNTRTAAVVDATSAYGGECRADCRRRHLCDGPLCHVCKLGDGRSQRTRRHEKVAFGAIGVLCIVRQTVHGHDRWYRERRNSRYWSDRRKLRCIWDGRDGLNRKVEGAPRGCK